MKKYPYHHRDGILAIAKAIQKLEWTNESEEQRKAMEEVVKAWQTHFMLQEKYNAPSNT